MPLQNVVYPAANQTRPLKKPAQSGSIFKEQSLPLDSSTPSWYAPLLCEEQSTNVCSPRTKAKEVKIAEEAKMKTNLKNANSSSKKTVKVRLHHPFQRNAVSNLQNTLK
jgi:hypothetical protein